MNHLSEFSLDDTRHVDECVVFRCHFLEVNSPEAALLVSREPLRHGADSFGELDTWSSGSGLEFLNSEHLAR